MVKDRNNSEVFIIDDEPDFLESVRWLLESANLQVRSFSTGYEFLEFLKPNLTGCLLTDLRMPGISGLELLKKVKAIHPDLPIIIMTAHGDVDTAVLSLKYGAIDFVQKPFNDQLLLDSINNAIDRSLKAEQTRIEHENLAKRFCLLSAREAEVLEMVVDGHTNKTIAKNLDISEKTVEVHRSKIMDKTQAKSLAELVRISIAYLPIKGNP